MVLICLPTSTGPWLSNWFFKAPPLNTSCRSSFQCRNPGGHLCTTAACPQPVTEEYHSVPGTELVPLQLPSSFLGGHYCCPLGKGYQCIGVKDGWRAFMHPSSALVKNWLPSPGHNLLSPPFSATAGADGLTHNLNQWENLGTDIY